MCFDGPAGQTPSLVTLTLESKICKMLTKVPQTESEAKFNSCRGLHIIKVIQYSISKENITLGTDFSLFDTVKLRSSDECSRGLSLYSSLLWWCTGLADCMSRES